MLNTFAGDDATESRCQRSAMAIKGHRSANREIGGTLDRRSISPFSGSICRRLALEEDEVQTINRRLGKATMIDARFGGGIEVASGEHRRSDASKLESSNNDLVIQIIETKSER